MPAAVRRTRVSAISFSLRRSESMPLCTLRELETMEVPIWPGAHFADLQRTGCLKFSDDFFGRKLGIRLGHGIIRRHEADCRLASHDSAGLPNGGHGRT